MYPVRPVNYLAPLLAAGKAPASFGPHEQWIRAFHQVSGYSDPNDNQALYQHFHNLGLLDGAASEIRRQKGTFWFFQGRSQAIPQEFTLGLRNEAIELERLMGVTHPVRLALLHDVDEATRKTRGFLQRNFPLDFGMALSLSEPRPELLDTTHQFFYPTSRYRETAATQQARVLSTRRFQNRDIQLRGSANSWPRLADYRLPGKTFNEVSRHRSIGLNSWHLTRLGGLTLMGLLGEDLQGNCAPWMQKQIEPVDILLVGGRLDSTTWFSLHTLIEIMAPRLLIMPSHNTTQCQLLNETWLIRLASISQSAAFLTYVPSYGALRLKVTSTENHSDKILIDETIDIAKPNRVDAAVDRLYAPVQLRLVEMVRSELADPNKAEANFEAEQQTAKLLHVTTGDAKRYLEGIVQNPYLDAKTKREFLERLEIRHSKDKALKRQMEQKPMLTEQLYHAMAYYLEAWGMR